jgi:CubicO group peptidase (beta-lactamase class C family)
MCAQDEARIYLTRVAEHKFESWMITSPAALLCYTSDLALKPNYNDQDHRFRAAFLVLEEAIAARAFPAASLAIVKQGELAAHKAFGRQTLDSDATIVTTGTVFDLASVSKVVATTTAAAVLYERGVLDLDNTVPGRDDLTIRSLLTHTSGLPAHIKFYEQTQARDELVRLAYSTPLEVPPCSHTQYSDIGFIILGDVMEQLSREPLDRFCQREIFAPLGMRNTCFNPPESIWHNIPPTRDDQYFRYRVIQGEVNDENAAVMNGVAAHAGVFSTSYDVALFAQCWLSGGTPILKPETVALFTRQQPGTERALGWDRPTPPSTSGQHFSPSSFGHIGYTGTTLWCDPEKQLAVALLTNRTWPDATNRTIRQVWPRFHDAVIGAP